MAGGQSVTIFGYEFSAKPKALWRRIPKLGDLVPYWQASKHHFILTIKRVDAASQETQLNWWIRFHNGQVTGRHVIIPPLQTGQAAEFPVGYTLLGYTGDTLLIISSIEPDWNRAEPYHTLYSFHTTPKSWLFLTITVAIGTALLASLGNWLIN